MSVGGDQAVRSDEEAGADAAHRLLALAAVAAAVHPFEEIVEWILRFAARCDGDDPDHGGHRLLHQLRDRRRRRRDARSRRRIGPVLVRLRLRGCRGRRRDENGEHVVLPRAIGPLRGKLSTAAVGRNESTVGQKRGRRSFQRTFPDCPIPSRIPCAAGLAGRGGRFPSRRTRNSYSVPRSPGREQRAHDLAVAARVSAAERHQRVEDAFPAAPGPVLERHRDALLDVALVEPPLQPHQRDGKRDDHGDRDRDPLARDTQQSAHRGALSTTLRSGGTPATRPGAAGVRAYAEGGSASFAR